MLGTGSALSFLVLPVFQSRTWSPGDGERLARSPRAAVAEPASAPLPLAQGLPDPLPRLPSVSVWSRSRILFLLQMISMCQGLSFPTSGPVPLGTRGPPRSDAACRAGLPQQLGGSC